MKHILFTVQPPAVCELCGKTDELRPYGPNGENICYECGMKDEETTDKKLLEQLVKEGYF